MLLEGGRGWLAATQPKGAGLTYYPPTHCTFYKRLASLLPEKWDQPYSATMGWLRCKISFSLLRSVVQCIRDARSSKGKVSQSIPPVDLVSAEVNLSTD